MGAALRTAPLRPRVLRAPGPLCCSSGRGGASESGFVSETDASAQARPPSPRSRGAGPAPPRVGPAPGAAPGPPGPSPPEPDRVRLSAGSAQTESPRAVRAMDAAAAAPGSLVSLKLLLEVLTLLSGL